MASTGQPAGKLPESVYWRRRLLVLLGLLAVIAIVALIIWRPGSSSGEERPSTVSTSTSTPSSTPTDAADAGANVTDESGDTPAPPEGEIAQCTANEVTVEAITDKTSYGAGENPQLSLSITNTSDAPCSINVGTTQQVFTITSGSEKYWTSTDCQKEPADAVVELAAGQTVSSQTPITWDRTRSATDTCDSDRPAVPAGGASYHLTTSVAGIESKQTAQFLLY